MKQTPQYQIFKKGSKTYFNSSLFFPENVRKDVFFLYAFVRVADDFVDNQPQQKDEFYDFKDRYLLARKGKEEKDPVIFGFVNLCKRKDIYNEWVDAFLKSMEMDLYKSTYKTIEETLEYIYGSAEVIGLFMARIMNLPEKSYDAAKMLGRSMQYINFIRDIAEDNDLGRTYLPINGSGLFSLKRDEVFEMKQTFRLFIREQLIRYYKWQREAELGFHFIPKRYRIAIKTASDMYKWTAGKIEQDPFIIYERKVKPVKAKIIFQMLLNTMFGS